jgi:hypothetical protein
MAERLKQFTTIARSAAACRECFALKEVRPTQIDVAQARWVGAHYWRASLRVLVLMCNPGEGRGYPAEAKRDRRLLQQFRAGGPLDSYLAHQRHAKWLRFYADGLQLDADDVAFLNVAWCSTAGNQYPTSVLGRCYSHHTEAAIRILRPHVILAAGRKVQSFCSTVEQGDWQLIPVLHHAHRKGRQAQRVNFSAVRRRLRAVSQ